MQHLNRHISRGLALMLLGMLTVGCRPPATLYPMATATRAAVSLVTPQANAADSASRTQTGVPEVTPSPTAMLSPTNTPTRTATPTSTPIPRATTPRPSPFPPDPTATPTATVTPRPSRTPLPATAAATRAPATSTRLPYRFLPIGPAQPDPSHPCPGCPLAPAYIVGRVVDAAGNPLAGVRLVCYNEWYRYPVVASKGGGEYDFNITQADTTWYVVVLDEADGPISPKVAVPFKLSESCRYILNWQRVD